MENAFVGTDIRLAFDVEGKRMLDSEDKETPRFICAKMFDRSDKITRPNVTAAKSRRTGIDDRRVIDVWITRCAG